LKLYAALYGTYREVIAKTTPIWYYLTGKELYAMSIDFRLAGFVNAFNGEVSMKTLFPDSFIRENTGFQTAKEFFAGLGITDQRTFDRRDETKADVFIRQNTKFSSWNDMYQAAARRFAAAKREMVRNGTWKEETFDAADPFQNIRILLDFFAM